MFWDTLECTDFDARNVTILDFDRLRRERGGKGARLQNGRQRIQIRVKVVEPLQLRRFRWDPRQARLVQVQRDQRVLVGRETAEDVVHDAVVADVVQEDVVELRRQSGPVPAAETRREHVNKVQRWHQRHRREFDHGTVVHAQRLQVDQTFQTTEIHSHQVAIAKGQLLQIVGQTVHAGHDVLDGVVGFAEQIPLQSRSRRLHGTRVDGQSQPSRRHDRHRLVGGLTLFSLFRFVWGTLGFHPGPAFLNVPWYVNPKTSVELLLGPSIALSKGLKRN